MISKIIHAFSCFHALAYAISFIRGIFIHRYPLFCLANCLFLRLASHYLFWEDFLLDLTPLLCTPFSIVHIFKPPLNLVTSIFPYNWAFTDRHPYSQTFTLKGREIHQGSQYNVVGDVNTLFSFSDTGFQNDGLWIRHACSVSEINHFSGYPGLAGVGGGGLTSWQN